MKKIQILIFITFLFNLIKSDSLPIGGAFSFTGPILELYRGKKVVVLTPGAGITRQEAISQGKEIVESFKKNGIDSEWLDLTPPTCAIQANDPILSNKILQSDAVFIGGGYSDYYQQCFFANSMGGSSRVLAALQEVRKTKLVGGSSAGSMVQPEKFILMTSRPVSSYQAIVGINIPTMDGSILFDSGLVDSHFSERGRQGRLFVHALQRNARFSFGVDEDSGLLENEKTKEKLLLGSRGTVVFDHKNRNLQNGLFHYLTQGDILLQDGTVVYPAWKSPCKLTNVVPQPSRSIFNDFRDRSFKVALYEQNILYSGLEGVSPVVEVLMQKRNETKVMCGEFQGKTYISISNMFVSMAARTAEQLNGRTGLPHVNKEPYYKDD